MKKQPYTHHALAATFVFYGFLYAYLSSYWLHPYLVPAAVDGIVLQLDVQDYKPQTSPNAKLPHPNTTPKSATPKANIAPKPTLPPNTQTPPPNIVTLPDTTHLPAPKTPLPDTLPLPYPINPDTLQIATPDTTNIIQTDSITTNIDTTGLVVYQNPDQPPKFPTGFDAMMQFISQNLIYPPNANGKTGTVYIGFIVLENGQLANPFVKKGIKNYPQFEQAALQILQKMPRWIPAQINNQTVKAYYSIPVVFNNQ